MAHVAVHQDELNLFIARHTEEPFYYQKSWSDLLCDLYGYTAHALKVTGPDGALTGYMPTLVMRSPVTGCRVVSLPFSDCCPPLADDARTANLLVEKALALAQDEHARYLELRSGAMDALDSRADLTRNDLYVRWVVPLQTDVQAVWKNVKSPTQRQVKKAAKQGVTVRTGASMEDMTTYYHLHLLTRSRKHGMPAQPLRYFERLWATFGASGAVRVLLAEYQGEVIAGMILLVSGSTVRYAYGASDERFLQLGPNNALMWEAISWAAQAGYTRFDMGRTARDNTGLMSFKRNWGAVDEPLPYYYHPEIAGLASTSEESWKYRALTACWRRLPLSVSSALGGVVYRHLG